MRVALALLVALGTSCLQPKAGGTNTVALSDAQLKEYDTRVDELYKLDESNSPEAIDKFEQGIRVLQRDYPTQANSSMLMMSAIHTREHLQQPDKAKALAEEMAAGSSPEPYKKWAKGVIHRLDSLGKPISLKFVANDGREVDLSQMKGKVVLVDFWATWCGPCKKELPRVKAAQEKFRAQGFEIIGISCDNDKDTLKQFVEKNKIPWPQYLGGQERTKNQFTAEFGINGIPHMLLVDKQGRLRFDNVRAKDGFEEQITKLLAEP
jgi:thiol-disulfide isomerase/thioredoxin